MNNQRENDLLARLGRLAAEEEQVAPDDEELELLCAGRLPDERVRALEARAAREPDFARRLEAYRPLAVAARVRIADALAREVRAGSRVAADDGRAPANATVNPGRDEAGVTPLRPAHRARVWAAVAGGLAAAAALVLLIRGPVQYGAQKTIPLPAYAMDARGGEQDVRGAPDRTPAALRLAPDSRVELVLRPATSVARPITIAAFIVPREAAPGGTAQRQGPEPLRLPFETSEKGTARLAGRAADLFGARRGRWQLRLIVEVAPGTPGAAERLAGADGAAEATARLTALDLWLVDAR